MTFQHVSDPAARVVSMAAHHARHGHTAEQRDAANRLLTEAELAAAMARDFDAAVRSAPTFPRGRRRPAPLSLFLAGCAVGVALAFGITAALAEHLIYRSQVDVVAASERGAW